MPTDQRITNSRADCFKTCARRHFFAYELGLRKATDDQPLRFGSAFHWGLNLWKRGADAHAAITGAVAAYDCNHPTHVGNDWLVEREQIARLLAGYFWRWSVMDLEIIASELPFSMPLVNPETGHPSRTFTLDGVQDAIVRLLDARLAVMEHKTTGRDLDPTGDYWKRLQADSQVSIYWRAAREAGYDIETVLYDVIRKPTIKPKRVSSGKIKTALKGEKYPVEDVRGTLAEIYLYRTYYGEPCQWFEGIDGETPAMYGARLTDDIGARPDFYYARQEIARLQVDLDEGAWDIWQTAKMIRECQLHNRWPRNTSVCIGFGRCPYFDLCTNGFDPSSGSVPDGFVIVDDVHPELKG